MRRKVEKRAMDSVLRDVAGSLEVNGKMYELLRSLQAAGPTWSVILP